MTQRRRTPHPSDVARLAPRELQLSGHGEPTARAGWTELARACVERGFPLAITTNLARRLTDAEAELLALHGFGCLNG